MPKLPQTEVAHQQKNKNDQERPIIYYGMSCDKTEGKMSANCYFRAHVQSEGKTRIIPCKRR